MMCRWLFVCECACVCAFACFVLVHSDVKIFEEKYNILGILYREYRVI